MRQNLCTVISRSIRSHGNARKNNFILREAQIRCGIHDQRSDLLLVLFTSQIEGPSFQSGIGEQHKGGTQRLHKGICFKPFGGSVSGKINIQRRFQIHRVKVIEEFLSVGIRKSSASRHKKADAFCDIAVVNRADAQRAVPSFRNA